MAFLFHRCRRTCAAVLLVWIATVASAAAQAPAVPGKGFIWTVEGKGRTGWLVGSLHLLTADAYPLPDVMTKAFRQAETLVEEADPAEVSAPATAAAILAKALFPEGQTLRTQLTPETYELLAARILKAGLPLEQMQRMKPWMIALTLVGVELSKGGFDAALGLDKHFHEESLKMGKPFRGLETALEQIDYLDQLGPEFQDSLVRETLAGAASELEQVQGIAAAWRAGDAAAIEELLLTQMKDEPRVYQTLIVDRNRRWVPKIEECLAMSRCFVVVGAAHLVGADGLVSMLRARGYTVRQQ